MAKAANELDLSKIKQKLNRPNIKKYWMGVFNNFTKEEKNVIDKLVATENLNCHIFAGSVTFRIGGKSSIKTVRGYASGFKAGFGTNLNAEKVFNAASFTSFNRINKQNFVHAVAFYFLYNHFSRVKTESDKTEAAEGEQISLTKSKLKQLMKDTKEVRIKVGDQMYLIDDFQQVTTRSKADAYFSYKRNPVIFLSLKKGKSAGDFQQYGGLVDLGIRGESYNSFPDIKVFRSYIDTMFKAFGLKSKSGSYDFNDLKKGSFFGFYLKNIATASKPIFGKDFGDANFGFDNCQATIDGDLNFKRVGKQANTYELIGEYHITLNPYVFKDKTTAIKKFNPGKMYKPVLFVQKSESQGLNQLGYLNARFNIWPNNKVASKGVENLNNIIVAIESSNSRELKALKEKYVK